MSLLSFGSLFCGGFFPLFFTPSFVPCLTRRRQVTRSSAQASHVLVLMWNVFMFLLQTSLKRRRGLPAGRLPSANSPYSRSLRMRPLSILLTREPNCLSTKRAFSVLSSTVAKPGPHTQATRGKWTISTSDAYTASTHSMAGQSAQHRHAGTSKHEQHACHYLQEMPTLAWSRQEDGQRLHPQRPTVWGISRRHQ